jgi:putative methyltransferase (TIGR04325 family)
VEQSNFVKVGQDIFSDEKLNFYYTIDECEKENKIHVILLSSVLQYIDKPYELLEMIKDKKFKYILFDKTPFVKGNDRITIQDVNPAIYKASYPCWFFNKLKFLNSMESQYDLITEFTTHVWTNIGSEFTGFLFKLKDNNQQC